jgi:hypothetical protein
MIEKIVHTAKLAVNAKVLSHSADPAPDGSRTSAPTMIRPLHA